MKTITTISILSIIFAGFLISSQAHALGKPLSIQLAPGQDTGFVPNDGLTNISRPRFVGTGPANILIRIQANKKTICQTKSTLSGDFKCTPEEALADNSYVIKVSRFAYPDFATTNITIDTTSSQPSTPDLHPSTDDGASDNDDITSSSELRFTGTGGEPNALIGVMYDNGATMICSSVVSATGTYDCTGSAPSGQYNFTAKQFDRAGNTSVSPSALPVTIQ